MRYSYYFSNIEEVNDLICSIIGVLDVISGTIVYLSLGFTLSSNIFIGFLSFLYFCLGVWSLVVNFSRKNYLDWRGFIDLINAFSLTSIFFGNVYPAFKVLGIIIIMKGIISLFLITTKEGS